MKRFYPSFEIAESWRRLAFDPKNIQPHDILLIKHELKEMNLMVQGMSQHDAHIEASKEYNYPVESKKFYESLGLSVTRHNKNSQNSGGIGSDDYDLCETWEDRY